MNIDNHTFYLDTQGFCHVIDVTPRVAQYLEESGLETGLVTIHVVGATAGITTVEFEPGLVKDLEEVFEKIAPATLDYHHEKTWHDGNGFSHVRASLLKPSITVPFVDRKMRLGTWQQIVVLDFDNRPRRREIALQLMGL